MANSALKLTSHSDYSQFMPPRQPVRVTVVFGAKYSTFTFPCPKPPPIDYSQIQFWSLHLMEKAAAKPAPQKRVQTDAPLFGELALNSGAMVATVAARTQEYYTMSAERRGLSEPGGLPGLKVASLFSITSFVLGTFIAARKSIELGLIGEIKGAALQALRSLRSFVFGTATTIMFTVSALNFALLFTTSAKVTKAAGILSKMGARLFTVGSILSLIGVSVSVVDQVKLKWKMHTIAKSDPSNAKELVLKFLQDRVQVTDSEKAAIREKIEGSSTGLSKEQIDSKVGTAIDRALKKKEAVLERLTSKGFVDKVKKASSSDAPEVVKAVNKLFIKRMILSSISIALLVVGLATTVMVMTATGGVPLMVASALSMVVAIGWLLMDAYALSGNFMDGNKGTLDKIYLVLGMLACLVAIPVALLFSTTWLAVGFALIFGLIWLSLLGIACLRVNRIKADKPA